MNILIILLLLYGAICLLMFSFQERMLFFPTKLKKDYSFNQVLFEEFEEINHQVADGIEINTLLFTTPSPKGVVLFFHGNAGALNSWGTGAELYLRNNYDVCYVDYRGYGKSDGKILSEKQLISDAQVVYDYIKDRYPEEQIIISGTSVGSGIATQIAAANNPKYLILTSPYFSLAGLIQEKYPFIPGFLIKYKLQSEKYLSQINCPIFVFHGAEDTLIPVHHGERLAAQDEKVELFVAKGFGHNDLLASSVYLNEMKRILN